MQFAVPLFNCHTNEETYESNRPKLGNAERPREYGSKQMRGQEENKNKCVTLGQIYFAKMQAIQTLRLNHAQRS